MRLAPSAVNKFPKRLALTTQASDITAVVALRAETAVRTLASVGKRLIQIVRKNAGVGQRVSIEIGVTHERWPFDGAGSGALAPDVNLNFDGPAVRQKEIEVVLGKSLTFGARPGSIPAMAWRRAFKGSSRRTDQPVRKSSLKSRSGRSFANGISHPTHRR